MIVGKVIGALKDGSFTARARARLQYGVHLYYVKDPGVERELVQRKQSAWLRKKYRNIIEEGVDYSLQDMKKCNKVWICWFQGEAQAPDLVKACIHSVRQNLPDREIIVLTEETIPQYVTFPDYIIQKWKAGIIPPAHYSDLLRTELLCRYGGLWIDATVLCTSSHIPAYITDAPLFVYKVFNIDKQQDQPIIASSWFISAYSNHPILLLTRKLLWEYWKRAVILDDYFLFHLFFAIAAQRYPAYWCQVPTFNNHSPHILQFELAQPYREDRWQQILGMSQIHKLNRHVDYSSEETTFYQHILDVYCP